MPKQNSYPVARDLYLVRQDVPATSVAKPADLPTNHIAVIDVSGSMSGELPQIREQLKKRLPKLLKEHDTISIIWFSGKGQFGTLLEAEPVATLADLKDVNTAIDRWLKPICLTGFKEPLEEVSRLVGRVAKKVAKNSVYALFFLSDGHDNQSSRPEILKAVEAVSGKLASATFVEYGYYADRNLLTAMAEKAGGSLIFAQHFDTYAPVFEAAMQKKLSGGKKVEIPIEGDAINGFAFAMQDGDLLTFGIEDGKVRVPEGLGSIWYLSPTTVGDTKLLAGKTLGECPDEYTQAVYAATSLFSVRMQPNVVFPLLKILGDVSYIDQFSNCFGKQKYSEFMDATKAAVFDSTKRLTKGYDPNKVPAEDAFTVLDLLRTLNEDDGNRILMDHPEFKYSRIGRARIDASENLTPEETAEIEKLTAELAQTKNAKKVAEITAKIAAVTANKPKPLKFEAAKAPEGYGIDALVYNEERPNISLRVRKAGTVNLAGRIPTEMQRELPEEFPSFVFRNYAIVKDGLVNVEKLPVLITKATMAKLLKVGVEPTISATGKDTSVVVIDVKALPVINRTMVKAASAKKLFELEYELTKARAAQKVYSTIKKDKFPRKSEGYFVTYGEAAAAWLKEQGLTDYSGFQPPHTTQAEASDFYLAKEMAVSIKGLSSLPSLNEFKKQAAKGKLNAGASLMAPAVKALDDYLASDAYTKASDLDKVFEAWLDGQARAATTKVRGLITQKAQILFAISVGQSWFVEFASVEDNSLEVTIDGQKLACKVEMKETKILL
jgi:hypothetical protein